MRTTMAVAVTAFLAPCVAVAGHHQSGETSRLCLECHDGGGESLTLDDGRVMSVDVDPQLLARSVHASVDCDDCHPGLEAEGHDERSFANRRAFEVASARVCITCHGQADTPHGRMVAGLKGRVCTDCHGGHDVSPPSETDGCMGCHAHRLVLRFTDGGEQTLLIDPEKLSESVHADNECTDCHVKFSVDEHPVNAYASKRELTLGMADSCKKCHFDKYTRTLESIHYDLIATGDLRAPGCVDCHGAHEIAAGQAEKVSSARRCRACHEEIYDVYTKSIHGSALVEDGNRDVPVCADCHEAHSIHDPRTVSFRNQTPELCATCHADRELMARYGLSAAVLESYLEDFHGVTLTFYRERGESSRHIAVCTDCHGIHDINSMHDADAAAVKSRLLERCRRCHPDAAESFPDSWISHYEPSLARAPLVFLVDLSYKIFIPFMLVGLVLQILLHVWRHSVKR